MKKVLLTILLLLSSSANAIVLTVGGNTYDIDPITGTETTTGTETASEFYSYSSPGGYSANTGYEQSNTLSSFLYYDNYHSLSMFFILDIYDDADGGRAQIDISSTGLAGTGMYFSVRDDPGDNPYTWNDATGSAEDINFQWAPCCTDGFVLGSIFDNNDNWSLTTDFDLLDGISSINFFDMNGLVTRSSVSSFTYSNSTSVPEPQTLALLSLGLLGLGLSKRKTNH